MKAAYILITALLIVMLVASAFTVTAGDTTEPTTEPTKEPTKETTKPTEKPTPEPTQDPNIDTSDYQQITVITGDKTITDAMDAKTSETEKEKVKIAAADQAFKIKKYPYTAVTAGRETITVTHYRSQNEEVILWVHVERDGREVFVDNPIHIHRPGHLVLVSEVTDADAKTTTVTLREDIQGAIERTIAQEVSSHPLGRSVVGTQPWQVPA